jgi:hypothetical protein
MRRKGTLQTLGSRTRRVTRNEKIGKPNAKISIRTTADGRKYECHATKGFRRWITTKEDTQCR